MLFVGQLTVLPSVRSLYLSCVLTACVRLDLQYRSWQLHLCATCSVSLLLLKILGLVKYWLLCCRAIADGHSRFQNVGTYLPCTHMVSQPTRQWFIQSPFWEPLIPWCVICLVNLFQSVCTWGASCILLQQNWSFEWVTLPVIVWEVPGLDLSPECLSWLRFFMVLLSPFCTHWTNIEIFMKKIFGQKI